MKNKITKFDFKKYFIFFMLYAIIGWMYEVFLEVVVYGWGFTNRGVLFGPYCPVYGFGALAFIFTLYNLIKGKSIKQKLLMIPIVFLGCMFIATSIELITSYICEFILGYWPWQTYVNYSINFEGRIALSPSIRFGIGGLIFLYILQPLFEKLYNSIKNTVLKFVFYTLALILSCDIIITILTFIQLN